MAGSHRVAVGDNPVEMLEVTQDEAAVIRLIRQTPYGEVATTTRAGAITSIERRETIKPPSMEKHLKPLEKPGRRR